MKEFPGPGRTLTPRPARSQSVGCGHSENGPRGCTSSHRVECAQPKPARSASPQRGEASVDGEPGGTVAGRGPSSRRAAGTATTRGSSPARASLVERCPGFRVRRARGHRDGPRRACPRRRSGGGGSAPPGRRCASQGPPADLPRRPVMGSGVRRRLQTRRGGRRVPATGVSGGGRLLQLHQLVVELPVLARRRRLRRNRGHADAVFEHRLGAPQLQPRRARGPALHGCLGGSRGPVRPRALRGGRGQHGRLRGPAGQGAHRRGHRHRQRYLGDGSFRAPVEPHLHDRELEPAADGDRARGGRYRRRGRPRHAHPQRVGRGLRFAARACGRGAGRGQGCRGRADSERDFSQRGRHGRLRAAHGRRALGQPHGRRGGAARQRLQGPPRDRHVHALGLGHSPVDRRHRPRGRELGRQHVDGRPQRAGLGSGGGPGGERGGDGRRPRPARCLDRRRRDHLSGRRGQARATGSGWTGIPAPRRR